MAYRYTGVQAYQWILARNGDIWISVFWYIEYTPRYRNLKNLEFSILNIIMYDEEVL